MQLILYATPSFLHEILGSGFELHGKQLLALHIRELPLVSIHENVSFRMFYPKSFIQLSIYRSNKYLNSFQSKVQIGVPIMMVPIVNHHTQLLASCIKFWDLDLNYMGSNSCHCIFGDSKNNLEPKCS